MSYFYLFQPYIFSKFFLFINNTTNFRASINMFYQGGHLFNSGCLLTFLAIRVVTYLNKRVNSMKYNDCTYINVCTVNLFDTYHHHHQQMQH